MLIGGGDPFVEFSTDEDRGFFRFRINREGEIDTIAYTQKSDGKKKLVIE